MRTLQIPFVTDNEIAHRQVKTLMKQHRILDIRLDESFALVSTTAVTGLQYMLTPNTWNWILNYLNTGDYEDFGIFPSDTSNLVADFQTDCLKQLIEQKYNIARIPFLRETEAYIKLRGLFRFGKLYFSIKRSDDFINYLESKGL
ncbi:hypothetical protein AAE250_03120 [Bacteroides sp. GD17]|uniref:hypothetical protein n=1 Tax=Bacteroides sp. GD17 TaxID=3139826 RepID=UPI00313CB6A3